MWACCPRQEWPHSSLIIKHYRVQVGNHRRGYQSPCIRHALKKELPFLEPINQWLGVLGDTHGMKMISLSDHRILRTCMTDLGWFQRSKNKLSRIHDGNLHQMHVNRRKSLLPSKHMLRARNMKIMLIEVSNNSLMFNKIMEEIRMLSMGSTTTHRNFHITGLPPSCEHGDSIGQTQKI